MTSTRTEDIYPRDGVWIEEASSENGEDPEGENLQDRGDGHGDEGGLSDIGPQAQDQTALLDQLWELMKLGFNVIPPLEPSPDALRTTPRRLQDGGITLMPHQLDGIGRLHRLLNTVGYGILADGMGAGKQYQVIGLILELLRENNGKPCIVVMPAGQVSDWMEDFGRRVSPAMRVLRYHGPDRSAITKEQILAAEVVVTTYDIVAQEYTDMSEFLRDFPAISQGVGWKSVVRKPTWALETRPLTQHWPRSLLFTIEWNLVAMEEGHNIKTPKAKKSRGCIALIADRRLLITGIF